MTKRLFGIVLMMMLMMTLSLKVSAGPVTVKLDTYAHGSVTVDKATANPGETVTITVTPDPGYYCEKENVKAEKTIDGGSAQAPGLMSGNPGVGSFVEIQGEAPADIRAVATYTFTMPEAPYGVQVTAEFSTCSIIFASFIQPIPDQEYTGSEITPNVIVADGDNQLTLGVDYTIEFSNNVEPGQATCTVKGISRYTGNVTVNFTIYRETYEIRWGITPQGSNDWDSQHVIAMTKGADGKWVAADQEMAATSEFKVVKKREAGETTDTWYGAPANNGLYWITTDNLNTEIQLGEGNQNLYFPHSGTYTFTFDPATTKLVVTGDMTYNVTVADGIQNGTVVANPTSGKAGALITITTTPDPGYELETLTYTAEGGEPVTIENNQFTMPAANVTINATFKVIEYHYSTVEEVKCSVVDASGFAPEGQTITMRVVPDSGTQFKEAFVYKVTGHAPDLVEEPINFTVTPVEGSTKDVDLSFVMPAGEVEAHIICADAYSITVNSGEHGSAQADKIVATAGETVTVTTYPNQDYKVDEIYYTYTIDGTSIRVDIENGDNGYTFTMPAADVLVVVTFKTIFDYYKLNFDGAPTGGTVSVEANGTVVNPMDDVAEFSAVRVTVTPAQDYEIESFRVVEGLDGLWGGGDPMIDESVEPDRNDGDEVTYIVYEEGVYGFDMPRNDATIIVTFKAIEHIYTVVGQPAELFGSETAWYVDNENAEMTPGDNGLYTWTSEPTFLEGNVEFKIVQDGSYDTSYPSDNYVIPNIKPGTYTVTITLNPATGEITVNVEGQTDVYVLGEINGSNTFAPNQGVKMTSEDGKIYTATITTTDVENGYAFFAFTHKLGADADDWTTANAYRFLAQSNGNFLVTGTTMNAELPMGYNGDNSMQIPAGEYTLTVDMENMKLTITGGTQLGYILASGVEGVDYTVLNDVFIVERSAVTKQFFVSDGNNWIALNAGDYYGDLESLKGGHFSGVFGGKNLNPYLNMSSTPIEGVDVDSVKPNTYLLSQEFAPKVDEVIIVSKAYYKASDNALRAYAPGGAQGQSCTVDNTLYSYDFEDGKKYTVKGVINIKGPWTSKAGMMDYDYPFQNYKLLVTEVTEEPIPTAINGIFLEEGVKSVRFYNTSGVESDVPFQGINIVVKEMNDGSRVTTKAIIK